MKTLLAIALAAAALTIGTATIAPISSTAVAGGGDPISGVGRRCAHRGRHNRERIVAGKPQWTSAGLSIGEAGWSS